MKDKAFILIVIVLVAVLLSIVFISPSSKNRKAQGKPVAAKARVFKSASSVVNEISGEQVGEDIKQAKAMISALVDMNTALKKNNSSLGESIKRVEDALGKANNENAGLKSSLEETTSKKEALVKEMASLKVVLDELKDSTAPIKSRLKDIAAGLEGTATSRDTKRQMRSLEDKLISIDSDIARLIKENNAYRISAQNLQALLSDKNKELEQLKKESSQGGPEKDKLKGQLSALSKELDQIKRNKSIFEDTITELSKKNASLNEELTRLNSMLKGKSDAPKQLEQVIRERDAALKASKNMETALASLNDKNEQLERSLNITRQQVEAVNKDYTDLKAQYNANKDSGTANESQLAKRADEILRLRDKLIVSEARMDEMKSVLSGQEKGAANLRERFVAIQLENESLRDDLVLTKNKLSDLKAQLSSIADMNNSLQGRLREIGGMLKGAKDPLEPQEEQPAPIPESKKVNVELVPQQ